MKTVLLLWFSMAMPMLGQANQGELQLRVTDPSGLAVRTSIRIGSDANHFAAALETNSQGRAVAARLPYGRYRVVVEQPGFAPVSEFVEIRASIPEHLAIQLELPSVRQSVMVNAANTLIDPDEAGSVDQVGGNLIEDRLNSIPGRSVQDLVNSQPGWLYEGNAVLHPRGSEYQTQFVVDGIPLTDNRSPSFGPEIEADDVQSMSIYTAGIPAEYGRKMGGVVEINTLQDSAAGWHGRAVLSGASFSTAGAFAQGQDTWGRNTLGGSASGSQSDHYLNPVVPQNYSNTGTQGDFSGNYRREATASDQLTISLRRELARYDIPNEMVQQQMGQRQTAGNFETMGIASWQHTFSANAAGNVRGMARDSSNDFYSNPESDPIAVFQHNWFREGYFKADATVDRGRNEWKAGIESDNLYLNEKLNYTITDPTQFDPGSALTFAYQANRPDLEQSAYLQDLIRLRHWTINAGMRWDHYQLLLNRQAFEPRVALSHYFQKSDAVLHFSYDRVFQTPSFENILLSSSPEVKSIDPTGFLNLPVQPSVGDYFEAGLTKVFLEHLKIGSNVFRRVVSNFADDSQIFNTTISFPISFRKGIVYGIEGKVEIPDWHRVSGFGSYSYMVGNAWFPVTGGLFFGSDASQAAKQLRGHQPDSQDQRHTARGRIRYQWTARFWTAFGAQYDSGLPFDFDGQPATVLAEYGPRVESRINFARGRIDPAFQANASAGAEVYRSDRVKMTLEADGENLNNILNVIDFGGLFSGNAIGPPRSFALRLTASF